MSLLHSANKHRVALVSVGSLLVLAACASPPAELVFADGQRLSALHQARVEVVSSWQLQGKVSIAHDGKLWHSGLSWFHAEADDRMNLTGLGGRTFMRLKNSPDGASAMDSKGRVYRASSFEELVDKSFGVDVPIANLRYWVIGMMVAGLDAGAVRFNENGSMKMLNQDGWEVRYLQYQPVQSLALQPIVMPALLVLSRGDLKLTLAVKHWKLIKFKSAVDEVV